MTIRSMRLRYEIAISIVLKLLLLFVLWYVCFSHPNRHPDMRSHLLSSPVFASDTPSTTAHKDRS